ncbi:DUF1801 domain-containing protein [Patescibacteria group bacterium]|nr:MAG: DUF1801 domain-containing protein [Patescibacteria group bacterium]
MQHYIELQTEEFQLICQLLFSELNIGLAGSESKIWHGHPVWFLNKNPTTGFSIQKQGVRLVFWSGADFDEPDLQPGTGKFKDASIFYQSVNDVVVEDLQRWLQKAQRIQWNYRDIVKNKGVLEKL